MAGKELKATEKTVLKHSREGVLEQNLADGSAKKVSNKAEEAVLKTARPDDERFDKLKAAGLVVEDVKKPDHRKLQFGRNNPDNTWAEAVYGNKPAEQEYSAPTEAYSVSDTTVSAEVRSYQYIEYDEEGNEILVTVYYDYYILNVTLTANDWDSVVKPKLEAAGVYDVYLLLLETKGNKPDLF